MSNQEAIDLLDTLIGMVEDSRNSDYDTAFRMGIKALEQEPKTGHWVKDEEMSIMFDIWTCSECGCGGDKHFKYCSHCGAKMEGE